MSRSASKGNAFVDDSDAGVLSDDVPARRAPSIQSGDDRRSDGLSNESSEASKPLEKRRSVSSEGGQRRAESFGEKGYDRGYAAAPATGPSRQPMPNYTGSFAPHPSFIRLVRFLLYGLASLSSLATAGVAISVINYYMSRVNAIKPSWGSLIALIVFGIMTPGALFIPFLITPRLFRYGTVLGIVNQVRIELLLLFGLAVIWVSGALATANDLLGYENCIWDGYYHVPQPDNFHHVCDLINATCIMGYVTFGLVTLAWFFVTATAVYILLYLDQEVLSELTNDMGGRAYRARTFARQELPPGPTGPSHRSAYSYRPNGATMHRRASSQISRRSPPPDDFDDGPSQFGTEIASRQIPNPDAAVPMSEKQAMAQRYAREPNAAYNGDVERGGPMMAPTAQEQRAWADEA